MLAQITTGTVTIKEFSFELADTARGCRSFKSERTT
jgi:hypothetical protein